MKPTSFDTTLARPKFVVHDCCRTISKQKPKIRIIHIVEPEIIKTDVENFQELVQRLTGKPVERKGATSKEKNASSRILLSKPYGSKPGNQTESGGVQIWQDTQRMKKEIEEIHDADNQNALLSFLGEMDGFLHDVNEFPLLSFRPSQINTFGVAESGIQQKVFLSGAIAEDY